MDKLFNSIYNFLYSLKVLIKEKFILNLKTQSEYKLSFIFLILSTTLFLLLSGIGVFYAAKALKFNSYEILFIMYSAFFYWDFGSVFFLNFSLMKRYWFYAVLPLNEKIISMSSWSFKRILYIFLELSLIIYFAIKLNFDILKVLFVLLVNSIIFALIMNIAYLIATIITKEDSFLLSGIVGEFQKLFSMYNPSKIKEVWFKFIIFLFLVPIYSYGIIYFINMDWPKLLIFELLVLLFVSSLYYFVFERFKKVYEAYGG